jgi:20S proteasome alpha/beta subunit
MTFEQSVKHTRYPWGGLVPREKQMTIAIGILAYDAVIIAADSQLTAGDWKLNESKVYGSSYKADEGVLTLGMTGAGYVANLKAFWQDLVENTHERPQTEAELQGHCRKTIAAFHQDHILPFAAFPDHARPGVDLILAAAVGHFKGLWTSTNGTLVREDFFCAVGTGSLLARTLIRSRPVWKLSIEHAVLMAIDVINYVKDCDANCGKRTHVLVINDRGMCAIVGNVVAETEVVCERYRDFAPSFLWSAFGAVNVDATAEVNAFHQRFEASRAEIRRQLIQRRLINSGTDQT